MRSLGGGGSRSVYLGNDKSLSFSFSNRVRALTAADLSARLERARAELDKVRSACGTASAEQAAAVMESAAAANSALFRFGKIFFHFFSIVFSLFLSLSLSLSLSLFHFPLLSPS